MNRKLGHQEQKREACYNQYILICGFKGGENVLASPLVFNVVSHEFLWFYMGSYVKLIASLPSI